MWTGIVMPAFNAAPWIRQAIDSVRAQTHADWLLMVVDDGSADDTAAIAASYPHDRRIMLHRQQNQGVSAARNAGRGLLNGCSAFLFLDADDWLAPEALERLHAAIKTASVASGPATFVNAYGQVTGKLPARGGDLLPALLTRNLFANGGQILIRATAIARAGQFNPNLRYGEDWEYWTRLAALGPFAAAEGEPALFVRQRAGGANRSHGLNQQAFQACLDAIFANPNLEARFGAALPAIRRRAHAEAEWVMGRDLIRAGERGAGIRRLTASLAAKPSPKRAALLAAAHALPVLPARLHGPFKRFEDA